MKTVDFLKKARTFIEDEENWCQRAVAEREDGIRTQVTDPAAVKFCALGCLTKLKWELYPASSSPESDYHNAWTALSRQLPEEYESVANFNDDSEHSRVLRLFDKAIEAEEAEEQSVRN